MRCFTERTPTASNDTAAIFFNSTPDALSLPQAALLLGQINAPTAYNPLSHRDRATFAPAHTCSIACAKAATSTDCDANVISPVSLFFDEQHS